MRIQLVYVSLLMLVSVIAQAQALTYSILVGNDPVGQLTATESAYIGGSTVVNIDSKLTISFIGSFVIESHQMAYFRRRVLQEAEQIITRNGKLKEQTVVKRTASGYQVQRKGENDLTISGEVLFTMGQLYHHEPKGISQVFSERFGLLCAVRVVGAGQYEVTLPNGSVNRYTYGRGVCQRMETTSNLKDVRFERRP
ncbi:DUF6134 family protein [uncultured Fibrella sp.]|uniref:DUF6134 family protein n=1 Tax=uncultured Fibrella sp. TaxID=1284596 RepID=UPI0035C9CA18